jgi:hypothetical protein
MTDFLMRLAIRALGLAPTVMPRARSRFETDSPPAVLDSVVDAGAPPPGGDARHHAEPSAPPAGVLAAGIMGSPPTSSSHSDEPPLSRARGSGDHAGTEIAAPPVVDLEIRREIWSTGSL